MIVFTWNIENFSYCKGKIGTCIQSPKFKLGIWDTTFRCLQLYPDGISTNPNIFCQLNPAIIVNDADMQLNIEISFVSKYNPAKNIVYKCSIEKGKNANICVFKERDFIFSNKTMYLPRDTLTIKCKVINSGISSSSLSLLNATTVIKVEKHIISIPLKPFLFAETRSLNSWSENITVTGIQSGHISEFKIKFGFEDSEKVNVEVQQLSRLLYDLFVIFQVLNEDKVIFSQEHLLLANQSTQVWKFDINFNMIELMSLKESYWLACSLGLSNGSFVSVHELIKSLPKNNVPKLQLESSLFLKRMYTESKCTDVTVIVGNKSFRAHKSVLSTASPVFEAMFQNEMKEKEAKSVTVTDVDEDTIEKMLQYIYSIQFEDLEFDAAVKLYSVADKYQILDLKKNCATHLSANLSIESVCAVASLSNLHEDQKLKLEVRDFILSNHKEIIGTNEWKKFMQHDIALAAEFMQYICLHL